MIYSIIPPEIITGTVTMKTQETLKLENGVYVMRSQGQLTRILSSEPEDYLTVYHTHIQ